MSGAAVTAGIVAVAAAVAGAYVSKELADDPMQPEKPPTPEKLPQGSKAPGAGVARRQNQGIEGGPMGGASGSTLLSGASGVSNDKLSLGKSTLLGQ